MKKTKPAPTDAQTTNQVASDIWAEALRAIRDEIRAIREGKGGESQHDPASRIAWLAKNAASIASEQRKLDADERRSAQKLTRAQVWAWCKLQSPEVRAKLAYDVVQLDATEQRSVLG